MKCSYVRFPQHPQLFRRTACNTELMKVVKSSSGTTSFYPVQLFCSQSLVTSIKLLVKRHGFLEKCEQNRFSTSNVGVFRDIEDGEVWKSFFDSYGKPFFSQPYNYGLCLNVDWFQPFKHSTYSAGAVYISILNLPRSERFKKENVLLCGIIPGPHEPKTMNTYLRPLVDDLKELWRGVAMESSYGIPVYIRAALICTSCDIPASRKVSGFLGHNAYHACSRCLKAFPTDAFGKKPDYSGMNRDEWPLRSLDNHRYQAERHKVATTRDEQKKIEREHGCRYSILLELPYYDVIRFCVVDPMHNLLLGTAKHMMSVWTSNGIINKSDLASIQEKVDSFVTPPDIERIPLKISSSFSGFTAEQWRNWTLIYSLFSLKGILPHQHYNCWLLFVKATSLLCRRVITVEQVNEGDKLLMEFCEAFQNLYGKEHYTINLHLHGHLKQCILDFGPIYSFWLFPYERLNGILGSYHTNCHDISLQLMRRYSSSSYHSSHIWPTEFRDQLYPLIFHHDNLKGSLQSSTFEEALQSEEREVTPLPPVHETAWELNEKSELNDLGKAFLGHNRFSILTLYNKVYSLSVNGFVLGSAMSRHTTRSYVMAIHPKYEELRLAKIECFSKLFFRVDICTHISTGQLCDTCSSENCHNVWIACVHFYDAHECRVWFGGQTQVWCRSSDGPYFILLSSIKCRVAYCIAEVDFGRYFGMQTVFVVSLLSNFGN